MLRGTLLVLGFCIISILCLFKGLQDSDFDAFVLGIATLVVPLFIIVRATFKSWTN